MTEHIMWIITVVGVAVLWAQVGFETVKAWRAHAAARLAADIVVAGERAMVDTQAANRMAMAIESLGSDISSVGHAVSDNTRLWQEGMATLMATMEAKR